MASSAVICQEQLLCAVTYALGLFAFGPFCNWLIQRYRRGLVCVRAIEGYTLCVAGSWLVLKNPQWAIPLVIEVLRFFTAACYGLAAIVLFGTLIVDKTESVYRTRANHSAAWLARLGIALGPLTAIVLFRHTSAADVCLWAPWQVSRLPFWFVLCASRSRPPKTMFTTCRLTGSCLVASGICSFLPPSASPVMVMC